MGDQVDFGDKHSANEEHKSFNWQHVWKSVEDAGTQASSAIRKEVSQIDTKELQEKAKHAASEGLKIARGHSSNQQANQISDVAAKYVPGAGLLRQGAVIAQETGAEGKFIEGKSGALHAPSEHTMKQLSKEAVGTAIPVPGGGLLSNELLRQTGVQDRIVDAAFDASKNHRAQANLSQYYQRYKIESTSRPAESLPKVVLEGKGQNQMLDSAREKINKIFHSLHTSESQK